MTATTDATSGGLRRLLPLLVLAAVLALFLLAGGGEYLSLDYLSQQYATLRDFVSANFLLAALGYVALYIFIVAISAPGAAPLTIAGGLFFGTLAGGLLTVVGATAGSVIIFLAAKTAFAETLREKAGPRVQKLQAGFERDALSYLFFLRLVPAFPFFLVNIAAGLFGVRLATFVLTTFFGIMPGTFVFSSIGAGAGAVIARGEDLKLSGVLSDPAVLLPILGLAALSLLPILLRRFRKGGAGTAS